MLLAHRLVNEDGSTCDQSLKDHLKNVASRAKAFALPFDAGTWAETLGLLHDAGKASDAFQRRIRGSSEQVDHSSAGAQYASKHYGGIGKNLAALIAGHHGGLPNCKHSAQRSSLEMRLQKDIEEFEEQKSIPRGHFPRGERGLNHAIWATRLRPLRLAS